MVLSKRKEAVVLRGLAVAMCGATIAGLVLARDPPERLVRADQRVLRGFQIAPVPLDLEGKDPLQVGAGSYIVNAQGGCNDCHTCPPCEAGHDPFEGGDGRTDATNYLAGGTPFGPTLASANLTPDPETGLPAGLTYREFLSLMRTGHDSDEPGEVLQVMPWPVYRNMLDADLPAVYGYLRVIPHAESGCGPTK
jgi:hypothetical protein